ncbi:hypothetical protein F1188_00475 [Roseospira marina]|uniref:Type VI secretion system effector TseH-like domain-containing protein n=1 Tax=Roseospira marina TaxID=140057 RepID=A0A5M6IG47_9PROT|nr:hypothetical protein [Roseospira marina]KAA5607280.1 hypothetical protein F1188_00475 [Roseospira marina]
MFPAYRITVTTPKVKVDLIPGLDIDNFTIEGTKQRVENLGHAGVLILRGQDGMTKYYEYGRYDAAGLGMVRNVRIPNVKMGDNGYPTRESLANVLREISHKSGHNGRISAGYIAAPGGFLKMRDFAEQRKRANTQPSRTPYSITGNNCLTFAIEVAAAGDIEMPSYWDPRPNGYVGQLQDHFLDLDYDPRTRTFKLESIYP